MKTMLLTLALVCALMAQNAPLANGVYAIAEGNANGKNLVVRQHEGKDVVLDTASFAPLTVAGKPQVQKDARGSGLLVQLAPEASKRLADLTRSHMNQRIAIVVGDKIVSAPTVRSVIQDGKARITPCQDTACETLLRELGK